MKDNAILFKKKPTVGETYRIINALNDAKPPQYLTLKSIAKRQTTRWRPDKTMTPFIRHFHKCQWVNQDGSILTRYIEIIE